MLDQFFRERLVHGTIPFGKRRIAFLDLLLVVCITGAAVMIRMAIFGISDKSGQVSETLRLLYCVLDFVLAFFMAIFVWKTTRQSLKTVGIYSLAVIWPAIAGNSALNGGSEVAAAVLLVGLLMIFAVQNSDSGKGFWLFTIAAALLQILQGDGSGEKLTDCWPNIYTLFSETGYYIEYGYTGKLLVLGILLLIFYYISKKNLKVTPELLTASGLFVTLFVGTFYPFMNYRSGLTANVLALLLFVQNQRKFYVPMALCIISYTSYGYAHGSEIGLVRWIYALALVGLMLDAGVYFYRQLQKKETT